MSGRGFWAAVLAGLILSAAGAVVYAALDGPLAVATAARIAVTGLGLAALGIQLRDRRARVGRLVCAAASLALVASLAVFDPPLWLWVVAYVAMGWLVRSLYTYDTLGAAFVDAGLTALALAAATAAARHTHSLFLAAWTYFLVQALCALVPNSPDDAPPTAAAHDDFDQAERTAEAALRRLSLPSRTTFGDHP